MTETEMGELLTKAIDSVELLWRSIGEIKEEAKTALYIDAIILAEECDDALRGAVGVGPDNIRSMFEACRGRQPLDRPVPSFLNDPNIDAARPFVSDRLWSLYTTIRAIYLRMLILAGWSYDRQQYIDWREDDVVNQHLRHVFRSEEVEQVKAQQLSAFSRLICPRLETEFLTEARRVLEEGATAETEDSTDEPSSVSRDEVFYHLLKVNGRVERAAEVLGMSQADVLLYRDELKAGGYLRTVVSFSGGGWRRTSAGDDLLKALEADRRE